ncbi:acyl-CoA dehydrogenase family protein [Chloroflexota bacterium]
MDFEPISGIEELKKEFDDFFREEMKKAPPGWENLPEDLGTDEAWDFHCYMAREMGKRGWLALAWPKKYGGQERSIFEQLVFNESRGYWRAAGWDVCALDILGPTLLVMGTDEQKERFLPPIARGEVQWCQGWTEPDAGSDLASLTTMAVRHDDYYTVNGQKVWCSAANRDWAFTLVRTSKELQRSRGISCLLIDLKSPGVTIRPLPSMASHREHVGHCNELFLDDVQVPVANRVGEENQGWTVTRAAMNFERSGIGNYAEIKRSLSELIDLCKKPRWQGEPLAKDPLVRHRLAQLAIEVEVGLSSARHLLWGQHKVSIGQKLPADQATRSFSMKYYYSELAQRFAYVGCQITGMYCQLKMDSKWAPLMGKFERLYQSVSGQNILGGTTEIQKNVIAWEGLGLPRV